MPALAHRHDHLPAPSGPPAPRLRALPPARRGAPSARAVALYALGLVAGFLLAGAASLPGGAEIVSGQLGLAVPAVLVAALAGLRARAVTRRRAAASPP
jgi:hypothetical protein